MRYLYFVFNIPIIYNYTKVKFLYFITYRNYTQTKNDIKIRVDSRIYVEALYSYDYQVSRKKNTHISSRIKPSILFITVTSI